MRPVQIILLLMLVSPSWAYEVKVGRELIEIPAPSGFVRVVPEMKEVDEFRKHFVPPTNEQLAMFIAEEEGPKALAGEATPLTRRFAISVNRSLAERDITELDFAQVRRKVRSDASKAVATAQAEMPELMAQASRDISRHLDTDLLIRVGGIVPLSPHYEDRS